jgi:hypothetical protein
MLLKRLRYRHGTPPEEKQIKSKEVQDLEVAGYRKVDLDRESAPRTVKSTLYNPVRRGQVDWCGHHSSS